jgi:sphingomyelin phosphodiesterase
MVIDHESWVMNLKEANIYDYPVWYKLYSARQVFQMPSLLPKDWDSLIDKMTNEPTVFDIYYKYVNYFFLFVNNHHILIFINFNKLFLIQF